MRTSTGEFCFNGVTRAHVIALCDAKIPILRDFRLDDVHAADEAFVTGTFGGITPVRRDRRPRAAGRDAGTGDDAAAGLYERSKDAEAARDP